MSKSDSSRVKPDPATAASSMVRDLSSFVRDLPDGCILSVRVHPGARRDAFAGVHAGALKIALTTPPVPHTDIRANYALITFLATALGLPKARIALLTGAASRSKTLRITGKSAAEIVAALAADLAC